MLFLLMQLDANRYALDIRDVAEVLPLVAIEHLPHAPPGVAGIVDYGGVPVPVVDLSELLIQRPAHKRLNTRLVVVHHRGAGGASGLLGLVAERATDTMRREPAEFSSAGVRSGASPYVARVAFDAAGPVYWLDVARLLPTAAAGALDTAVNA